MIKYLFTNELRIKRKQEDTWKMFRFSTNFLCVSHQRFFTSKRDSTHPSENHPNVCMWHVYLYRFNSLLLSALSLFDENQKLENKTTNQRGNKINSTSSFASHRIHLKIDEENTFSNWYFIHRHQERWVDAVRWWWWWCAGNGWDGAPKWLSVKRLINEAIQSIFSM